MDVKAFRKAEDSLSKAVQQYAKADLVGKRKETAAAKIVEAAAEWEAAREANE